jgi:hypothetical protein
MKLVNELWEQVVMDLVTKQFPNIEDLTGVRIVDKSRAG